MNRLMRALVAVVLGSLLLTGCDFDVYKLPLPGGADVGDDPVTLTIEFDSVLDLVPQSSVKLNDVTVGKVKSIGVKKDTDGAGQLRYIAEVEVEIRGDTQLPADLTASIRQTSLLGEKFVSLSTPEGDTEVTADTGDAGDTAMLQDGALIPLDRTDETPEVEQVLGALSLLLNDGGLGRVQSIATEVNAALDGREDSVKSLLTQVASFMGQLDANKEDIVDAIQSLNDLAKGVRREQPQIDLALEELPSALLSLDRQRGDLVKMLKALDNLGDVGVRVIRKTKVNTMTVVRQLQPTLTQLANAGDDLVNSFSTILTFPFVDEVVGRDPQVARNLHMGDYVNLSAELVVDLGNFELPGIPCTPLDAIPQVGPLPDFEELCAGAQDALAACIDDFTRGCLEGLVDSVCDATPANPICDLLDGVVGGLGGLTDGVAGALDGLDGATSALPGLPGLGDLGNLLNRPAVGSASTVKGRGPTMGQMMAVYDPALVSLLTPGMVLR